MDNLGYSISNFISLKIIKTNKPMKKQQTNKSSLTVEKLFGKPNKGSLLEADSPKIVVGVSITAYRGTVVHCIGQVTEKNLETNTMTVVDIDHRERYFPITNGALVYEVISLKERKEKNYEVQAKDSTFKHFLNVKEVFPGGEVVYQSDIGYKGRAVDFKEAIIKFANVAQLGSRYLVKEYKPKK